MSTHRSLARAGVVTTAGLAALFATAGLASAHVTVQPAGEAAQGGYAKVAFRVPNERPNAGTVKLEVALPKDKPLTSVLTKPLPGWRAEVTKTRLDQPLESHGRKIEEVVSAIVWTAEGGTRINPGEFQEFEVSLGQLPKDTDQLVLPATQTYDNGEVVRWDAPPPAKGAEEPNSPAPVLRLVAKKEDGHGTAAASGSDGATAGGGAGTDNAARWLGGAGLAVGALGLGLGIGAVARGRRKA
ncbi:Uncharacterized protein YcnI [Streptoalloteichus tenebrarius]|uniref:Uncharacterized protein YcnI n=1 Tax=Streptoalloteichus tenebrarius (strain ATCC 17920 / DSM 40477 / JCM 4838 / CBS 697.72 / NBRC 16177 / NCIMB 11028 / NRRL B-12390 / A12253. 1 / ISP 5477) TaxID=1933 RepID=A0ABT1HYK6_STRSD|nr:YcnI family protein [Streptoalloteichus tenebrarius]MCP2260565.1 Uncharacterized protein YcnI [Streptoalloteichus tenebrarius]BFF01908.1 hypothetical protein GCM10020241_35830 [Streptoalloteichus tenebrarius]